MMLFQVPAPPAPPELPQVIVSGGPPEWVGAIAVLTLIMAAIMLYPLIRALARRLEGGAHDPALRGEVDGLHARLAEMDQLEQRVAELENRVEFSERLLTRQRDAALPPGEPR
jgi:chromatin segregation and condensation protein Rec8/ScpA/Scc1 (kleisin family)